MQVKKKAKVFMSGRSQAVRIPLEFRFAQNEVLIRKDETTGDLVLSEPRMSWGELFAVIDADPFPEEFMKERKQGRQPKRVDLR